MPSTYRLRDEDHDCDCLWQNNLRRYYLLAHIPKKYWTLSANDFFGDGEALDQAQEYLDKWEIWREHGIGMTFYSPIQGTGKTMLATIIAKDLIQRGVKVYFTTFSETLRIYAMPYEKREAEEHRLRTTPVLILDEIREAITDAQGNFYASGLEDLMRYRVSHNLVTIITTNLTSEQLDAEFPRTFSLLAEQQRYVHVNGEDARRAGNVDLFKQELILNGEVQPIV